VTAAVGIQQFVLLVAGNDPAKEMMGGTEHLFMRTHDHKKFPFLVSGQQTSRTELRKTAGIMQTYFRGWKPRRERTNDDPGGV